MNKGDLATIGRYRAVGVLAGQHLTGWFAWWTWLLVHIMYLAGFRNQGRVLLEWGYSFFTLSAGLVSLHRVTCDLAGSSEQPVQGGRRGVDSLSPSAPVSSARHRPPFDAKPALFEAVPLAIAVFDGELRLGERQCRGIAS